jgi:hypothetical protein
MLTFFLFLSTHLPVYAMLPFQKVVSLVVIFCLWGNVLRIGKLIKRLISHTSRSFYESGIKATNMGAVD